MNGCLHCGEKCRGDFCCVGCREVHSALSENGLLTFYELGDGARPSERKPLDAQLRDCVTTSGDRAQATWFLDGLHCQSCVWLISHLPDMISTVDETTVDLRGQRLTFSFSGTNTTEAIEQTHAWLQRYGYNPLATKQQVERHSPWPLVGVAWFLAANVMSFTVALYAGLDFDTEHTLATFVAAVITLLTVGSMFVGRSIFVRGFASIRSYRRSGTVSIDLPIALGMAVAFVYSVYGVAVQNTDAMWFDSIAVIVAALLTSRALNATIARDVSAFTHVESDPIPGIAYRLVDDRRVETRVDDLRAGDVVALSPGDIVPCDGVAMDLVEMDRSTFSGESKTVWVPEGAQIFAGEKAISEMTVNVRAVGSQTQLAELLASLDSPLKAALLDRTDRIAARFTALVLLAAAVAFILGLGDNTSISRTVAVLLVACPCAVAMAAPLGFSAALARLRRDGILVRDAATLEKLASAKSVVFDKTGTVTTGEFKFQGMQTTEGFDTEWLFDAVCAIEQETEHPIRSAFPRVATKASDVALIPFGVQGIVDGKQVSIRRIRERKEDTGLDIFVDGTRAATITIADEVRTGLLSFFSGSRVPVSLLSGDCDAAVKRVAERAGISTYWSEKSPEEKRDIVATLPRPIVYVGDGLNDVAALREADVGVSIREGHTANLRHSDVAFVSGDVDQIVRLTDHSKAAIRTLKRALGVSLFYNAAAVTASVLGLVSPLVAAVAMPVSSTTVVFLASTLLRRKQ